MAEIAIIGAGYAGLACAVELARQHHRVSVFERSMVLGGRARVVTRDQWRVDNGQHILIGAYSELTRMLRLVGVSPKVLERRRLTLHVPGKLHLQAAPLPAPFHLAIGLLFAKGLSWTDKRAMARLMRYLKHAGYRLDPALTVRGLLHTTAQTERLKRLIWHPLCVAALNTPPEEASAQVFANVLGDSLGADAHASELLLPRVDLSELFPVHAGRYLATHRGRLNIASPVNAIERDERGFALTGGAAPQARFEHVVIATAPYHAAALLNSAGGCERLAAQIDALPHEPITTLYFAFGENFRLPEPMMGLDNGHVQWVFDRGQFGDQPGLISMVISARGEHEHLAREALELAALHQLEDALGTRLPAPQRTLTITEKRATFACRPGVLRPQIRTPIAGLWLAGDYLDSPYPATLESAVRSGVAVAAAIQQRSGAMSRP